MMVPVQAAESIITTNVYPGLFEGTYNATYESAFGSNLSFFVGAAYYGSYSYSGDTGTAYNVNGGLNYYFTNALEGFYAGGGASVVIINSDGISLPFLLLIGYAGYKYYFNDRFLIDGKVGLGGLGIEIGYVLR
jgi:hypothetical protein